MGAFKRSESVSFNNIVPDFPGKSSFYAYFMLKVLVIISPTKIKSTYEIDRFI